jgi:hydroxyacylglutathione hydrolase
MRTIMDPDDEVQYVCQVCGYNMIGYLPDQCPFCGSPNQKFLTAEENSTRRHVIGTRVNNKVTRLNSVPHLGYEHAAYRIDTGTASLMIDCPSTFDRSLPRIGSILFTHHHFLGACNQYRTLYPAEVAIHGGDAGHDICRGFTFDTLFGGSFTRDGLSAMHLGGHTPGFTCYCYNEVLFICDYVIRESDAMVINPYGPEEETRFGLAALFDHLRGHPVSVVCGVDYVMNYPSWDKKVRPLLRR